MARVAVLGAGSWGTALSLVLADNGHDVHLWSRREEQVTEINQQHTNIRYLSNVTLPANIHASSSLSTVTKAADVLLLVMPTKAIRDVLRQTRPLLTTSLPIIHASKGIESGTHKRVSEIIAEEMPATLRESISVLSGPSHAEDVGLRHPTTVAVSADQAEAVAKTQSLFINQHFRVYTNDDMTGVELGGSLKNIIALGAGMSDGLGFGDNAKAALITRGLAEIQRLGVALGASAETFAGLAGMGDLIVTCTSQHSRNWRAGYAIGQGKTLNAVLDDMGMVVEGVKTTEAVHDLAAKEHVDMPITNGLSRVLFSEENPETAVKDLMNRMRTNE